MKDCIAHVKRLIHRQVMKDKIYETGERFSEYNKTYYWTNEQISSYLHFVDFGGKDSALSVTASGDHTFNLISHGITNIDTFDTNKFTEYFALGLKRAMILKYDYLDFCHISSHLRSTDISLEELSEIVLGLLPYMELKHQIFWEAIIDYNFKIQVKHHTNLNLFLLLSIDVNPRNISHMFFNDYIKDEERYLRLKEHLRDANITFTWCNAIDLPQNFNKKYDFIMLSNILDYFDKVFGNAWKYEQLLEYERKLEALLNDDGVIFLHYIMAYMKDNERFRREIITNSNIVPRDLTQEEIFTLPPVEGISNAIILKRMNNLQK